MSIVLSNLLSLVIGYLIGSISPSYFLGKLLKGIDIREYGTKNAGATNTRKVLGIGPAIIVALFDLSKGLLSMLIAYKLGVDLVFIYAAGFLAILGHVFPFYLKFKGGQGVGVAVGMMLYLLVILFKYDWFPFYSLLVLAILSLTLFFVTHIGEMIGLFVLPSFLTFLYLNSPFNLTTGFLGVILLYILLIQFINIKKFALFKIPKDISPQLIYRFRTVLRPLAVLFILFYFYWDKKIVLTIVGVVALLFILLDLTRLIHKGINLFLFKNMVGFFKQTEERKFSSMTLFLVACFVTILIFEKNIAMTALIFLIFGDFFARIFGLIYGKRRFLGKTLEGSLAYFTFSLVFGYIFSHFIDLPILMLVLGALSATLVEASSPFGIDDNFTVALISASVMYITKIF
jgi:glycerol-3-phosphate acyltransferase PlsY